MNILIPPLSERKSDIFLLAHHFIALFNERYHKNVLCLEDEVTGFFLSYDWPGNVRQLKHCIEGAMNLVGSTEYSIKRQHLPFYLFRESGENDKKKPFAEEYQHEPPVETLESYGRSVARKEKKNPSGVLAGIHREEREAIIAALKKSGGNVSKAARELGLSRQTLVYRMKKYEID